MREPCPTGYICREPRDGSGCGRIFDEGPDGAWWWRCECGGMIHPRTQAEADAHQETLVDVKPYAVTGDRYRCVGCQWEGSATSEEMILHLRGSLHRRRSEPMTRQAEAEAVPSLFDAVGAEVPTEVGG